MAKQVMKWEASDGRVFDTQADAEGHEAYLTALSHAKVISVRITGEPNSASEVLMAFKNKNTRTLILTLLDMCRDTSNS